MNKRKVKRVEKLCDWCHKPLKHTSIELSDVKEGKHAEVCMPCLAALVGVRDDILQQMRKVYSE